MERLGYHFRSRASFLRHFNCSMCEFYGPECYKFLESVERTGLKSLIFEGNLIGDSSKDPIFGPVDKLDNLKTLSLNACRIGCKGATAIAQTILRKSQLINLSLQGNRIKVFLLD